jgi:hypothetical protein
VFIGCLLIKEVLTMVPERAAVVVAMTLVVVQKCIVDGTRVNSNQCREQEL